MTLRRLLFAALILLGACSLLPTVAPWAAEPAPNASHTVAERYQVQRGIHHDKLTLYPIVDTQVKPRPEGDFDLLQAALERGTLTMTEVDNSGTVATLKVVNRGSKPVLLLAGDVITGGKQDRIVTEDLVLANTGDEMKVAVNCVEAGRWSQTSEHFAYGGKAEMALKRTVEIERDQSATWRTVDEINSAKADKFSARGAFARSEATGTYHATLSDPEVLRARDAIVTGVKPGLDAQKNVVGLVVAIGDEIIAGEIFGHPSLFEKSEENLLRAVALDAVTGASGTPPATTEAASFLEEVLSARATRTEKLERATRVHFDAANVEGTMLRTESSSDGDSEVIHLNSYKKKK